MGTNRAGEETNPRLGQSSGFKPGVPPKSTHSPCLSQATAVPAASRVWLSMQPDLFGVFREVSTEVNTFPSPAGTPASVSHPEPRLAACSLLPLLIRSPAVLYYAKIILLLPMKIMSEPSTLPCLMQKAAPQGRGGPGCSYKAY